MIENVHVKYPLYLSDFNRTRLSSTDFEKMMIYLISNDSIQWEPSRHTDRYDKANSKFWRFADRASQYIYLSN